MNKFKIRVNVATDWSLFTQADHYDEYIFTSDETLQELAIRLNQYGFKSGTNKWIMPTAILEIKQV